MSHRYRADNRQSDENHPEIMKPSKAEYDEKNPIWSFRPTAEMLQWLEEERWDDTNGKPETNAALVMRKLEKLRKLEKQGY